MDQAIIRYVHTKYKLLIGEHMAERAKIQLTNLFDPREDVTMYIKGRNLVSGMPEQIEISETEIFEAVEDEISDIIEAIKTVLEETPPELVGDIYENGVIFHEMIVNIYEDMTPEGERRFLIEPAMPLDTALIGRDVAVTSHDKVVLAVEPLGAKV